MDTDRLWSNTLDVIKISVSSGTFSTWFLPTFIVSLKEIDGDKNLIEIGCSSPFLADGLEKRYSVLIQDSLNQTTGKKNNLIFSVQQKAGGKKPARDIEPLFWANQPNEKELEKLLLKARIQPGFSFENFAVSSTNQLPWAAAEAVSKNIGRAYNPLFIWGGVGIGKTHLMLAIGHRALAQNPNLSVLYCMGEEFTNEIVDAIRTKTTQDFKNRYRKLDLLLIDDVQFIAGKNETQAEFFHTFNTLKRVGGQIVLTSDRPPSEINKLEDRLKSRFEAGLIIDISPPDFELRTAISLIKAQEKGIEMSMEAAQTIASHLDSPRRIEGFITRLVTEKNINGLRKQIDKEVVLEVLKKAKLNNENGTLKRAVLPQDCINTVSTFFSLGKRRLLGENRSQVVVVPRQILMYLLRVELGLSFQEVGRLLGNRDHTTIMHGVEKISSNLSTNDQLRKNLLGIKQILSG